MKPKLRHYLSVAYELLLQRPISESLTNIRYKAELGGRGGYRVVGPWNYPGRYLSVDQILSRCEALHVGDDLTVCIISAEHGEPYTDRLGIERSDEGTFELEIVPAGSQCYSFVRSVTPGELTSALFKVEEICEKPEGNGFKHVEW